MPSQVGRAKGKKTSSTWDTTENRFRFLFFAHFSAREENASSSPAQAVHATISAVAPVTVYLHQNNTPTAVSRGCERVTFDRYRRTTNCIVTFYTVVTRRHQRKYYDCRSVVPNRRSSTDPRRGEFSGHC